MHVVTGVNLGSVCFSTGSSWHLQSALIPFHCLLYKIKLTNANSLLCEAEVAGSSRLQWNQSAFVMWLCFVWAPWRIPRTPLNWGWAERHLEEPWQLDQLFFYLLAEYWVHVLMVNSVRFLLYSGISRQQCAGKDACWAVAVSHLPLMTVFYIFNSAILGKSAMGFYWVTPNNDLFLSPFEQEI